ncbi:MULTISPECIES: HdeA/HdeB family chaperone [unclassified Cupriavidus]|uniref:HdeA/HdeB family chaperone n=1 Tax=unclassified Cupriavidus TaxID=2640874 RepID=UPI0013666B95|nr:MULTISPECIES: HdeA/HdeB family chaperone [unclassified Cupriavidus]
MKLSTLSVALAFLAVPLISSAATSDAKTDAKTVKPFKMSCEDFLSVSEAYKPAVVYWVASVDKHGVRENDEIVVDEPQIVDKLVDECKKTPKQNFASKVKSWVKQRVLWVESKV